MIELRALCRTFRVGEDEVRALRDVNLCIGRGEYLSVMGPSGSGKSTLLNMLGLLDRPDSGEYLLDGQPTARLREEQRARLRREHVGFVFQSYHLVSRLTARENIELPLMLAGSAPRERRRMVDGVLERLGIGDRAGHLPNQLSGGERQRVAIGRALLTSPRVLLMDEPLSALDLARKAEILPYLERLHDELEIPILYVSHAPDEVARLADYLVALDHGRAVAEGPLSATLARLDLPIRLGEDVGVGLVHVVAGQQTRYRDTVPPEFVRDRGKCQVKFEGLPNVRHDFPFQKRMRRMTG